MELYLFLGFLEGGKTTFIRTLLGDRHFNNGRTILILSYEDGPEMLAPDELSDRVFLCPPPDNADGFLRLQQQYHPDMVLIEANGMQKIGDLRETLPASWEVTRTLLFADAGTFSLYNRNLRSLLYDKVRSCDSIVFNRCNEHTDFDALHRIVRGISSLPSIVYQMENGRSYPDTAEDALPYDLETPVLDISDRDYAFWYRDLMEHPRRYQGKTVRFKCRRQRPDGPVVIGREIILCCAEDMTFGGLLCESDPAIPDTGWFWAEGEVRVRMDGSQGGFCPVICCRSVQPAPPPEEAAASIDDGTFAG